MKRYHKKNPEARKNQSRKVRKWYKKNPERWRKVVEKFTETKRSSEHRKEASRRSKEFLKKNPEFKKKLIERTRNMWKDEKLIKKMIKNKNLKPNGSESELIQLFNTNNLPYKYVGDFSFMLNGRNPDFVNSIGKKKVIELFGKFWHTKRTKNKSVIGHVKDRKDHFKKEGYDTLIIWDYELKNPEKVVEKVKIFNNI